MLFALTGTLISRTMPRRLSIAGIAYVVVFVGLPTGSLGAVAVAAGYLLQVALIAAIGWFGLVHAGSLPRRPIRSRSDG
ncbi:hypothetical protein [Streptosporangium sandarakinum]|uniref:hypothetical protein n=1 Tax=Streptosporangium sandarakinum TaxID=1260955 RepID=UPI003416974F